MSTTTCLILATLLQAQSPDPLTAAGTRELNIVEGCVTMKLHVFDAITNPEFELDRHFFMVDEVGMDATLEVCWSDNRWDIQVFDANKKPIRRLISDGDFIDTGDGHLWSYAFHSEYFDTPEAEQFDDAMWPFSVAMDFHLFPVSLGRRPDFKSLLSIFQITTIPVDDQTSSDQRLLLSHQLSTPSGTLSSGYEYDFVSIDDQLLLKARQSYMRLSTEERSDPDVRETYTYGAPKIAGFLVAEACNVEVNWHASPDRAAIPMWTTTILETSHIADSDSQFEIEVQAAHTIHYEPTTPNPPPPSRITTSFEQITDAFTSFIEHSPYTTALSVVGMVAAILLIRIGVTIAVTFAKARKSK